MNILYIDPIFGISGDMMISAFLDAGMPFDEFDKFLKALPVDMPSIEAVRKQHGIIEGTHLNIAHSEVHLSIIEMERLIGGLSIEPTIKTDAMAMLRILVEAEAKVHGVPRNQVHFHELSHIDTLIDLLSVAWGVHYFGIEKVYCGPIPMGRGTIRTSHGVLPNPPPATVEILSGYKLLFFDEPVELTTPTGAAIVRHYAKDRTQAPAFAIKSIGYGMGSYDSEKPDVLRIFVGHSDDPSHEEEVWLVEVDIDDMQMEYVGAVVDRIRQAGALDVLYFPVYMKKGRIGTRLSITAPIATLQQLIDAVFAETTTFGVRLRREQRRVLRREEKSIQTSWGPVRLKNGYDRKSNLIKTHIEFDDVKDIADREQIPYHKVLEAVKTAIKNDTNLHSKIAPKGCPGDKEEAT
ncbi:MAG: hypothetical protein A4E63_03258 [Syntrophorhabdus sp. PtaU1.Bin050]|nr:MAG: hypothetical protein A4E63_03258 [Syntrophorhabdus sp. PtaU1.Bin050]